MNQRNQVIILSAELEGESLNDIRSENLANCINDLRLPFCEAQGVYNGVAEKSFIVVVKSQHDIDALKNFAFKNFNQESILHSDSNGHSELIFKDDTRQALGILNAVNKDEALASGNYTLSNGEYYICKAV
jgi:hypothetical protein